MNVMRWFRRHLLGKLFLSYLIVILVGGAIMFVAAELVAPRAFERHMGMMANMGGMGHMEGMQGGNGDNLFMNYRAALTESLVLALLVTGAVAGVASIFISRRVVAPVQAMMTASQHIAQGHYAERVQISGSAVADDLDELGELAVSFNQMAAQLAQTEVVRQELIGNVAHELRTPLTTIKGTMEALIDGVLPAEAETFQQVYREADRLQRLAHDLQELSRVQAGAFELKRTVAKPSDLIATVTDRLKHQFAEKGVSLTVDLPSDLPPVLVDEGRVGQVLLNLVGNALQYTPEGGDVQVSGQVAGRFVQIEITDSGIGLTPEHLSLIFTRFYRVDKSRSRVGGGSGIGLTIARHLVEAHGGHIWATSPGLGQGSTFALTLPVAA